MGLILIPRGHTDDATITSTPAAVPGLGPDNLQVSDRGAVYRVLGDSATLQVDLPSNARIGALVLWRHRLSTAANWRVRLYDEPALGGTLQYDSETTAAIPAKALGELDWGIDPLGAAIAGMDYSYMLLPDDLVTRSIRIDIADPGAERIEVGRLFGGGTLRPTFNFRWGQALAWERDTVRTRTAAGGLRVEAGTPWRRLKIALEWLQDDERAAWASLLRDAGNGREIWISARTGEGGRTEADNALLGYLVDNPEMTREQVFRYSLPLEIEEA